MNSEKIFVVLFPRYMMLFFIFCVSLAMYLYKGGIYHSIPANHLLSNCSELHSENPSPCDSLNHHTVGYSFTKNFLSDLGRTKTHSLEDNFHSSLLFNMALTLAGVTYVLFYIFLWRLYKKRIGRAINLKLLITSLGSIFGVLGGICFIGVAFTPADLSITIHEWHNSFNMWAFKLFLAATICYTWIIYKSKIINNKYLIMNLVFLCSLCFYVLVLIYGPSPREPGGILFQGVSQKFIMFNFIFSIIAQTLGFNKLIKKF